MLLLLPLLLLCDMYACSGRHLELVYLLRGLLLAGAKQGQPQVHLVHEALDFHASTLRQDYPGVEPRQFSTVLLLVLRSAGQMHRRVEGGTEGVTKEGCHVEVIHRAQDIE